MLPVCTADQVRELDRHAIETLGLPGISLMETASEAVARAARQLWAATDGGPVVVVCGSGNNGGDGYGCARWLHSWGVPVALWSLAGESRGDAAVLRRVCDRLGLPQVDGLDGAGLIVDAIFGTGLDRTIQGPARQAIAAINAHPAPVVSIDLPSGLDADTGQVLGVAVRAHTTVTLAAYKAGLFCPPGSGLTGELRLAPLGLPSPADRLADCPDRAALAAMWPARPAAAHKTRSGHLLVVAGSTSMAGAAILCCRGAFAAGVGLVSLVAPRGALPRLAGLPAEVMVHPSGDGDRLVPPSPSVFDRVTAAVIGPGLGGGDPLSGAVEAWVRSVWRDRSLPLCFDADALLPDLHPSEHPRVITPHPGEAGRLLGRSTANIQSDRFNGVRALSKSGCTALLKGRHTLVASPGLPISVNMTGNQILGTAGSGDVLSGIVAALLARGVGPHDAARLGAHVHGLAADHLAEGRPQGWTATDIAEAVPCGIEALFGRKCALAQPAATTHDPREAAE